MIDNVDNTLIISSIHKDDLEEFLTKTNYDHFDFTFNVTVPMPDDFKEKILDEKDWSDWRLKKWGVKWDAIQSKTERIYDTLMRIYFITLNEAPLKWSVETSKKFPKLKFKLNSTYIYDVVHEARIEQFIIKEGSVLDESTHSMVS